MILWYSGGALWQSIYRIPIGPMSTIYGWLLMCYKYTLADVCAYMHTFILIPTQNILLLTKQWRQIINVLHAYIYTSYYLCGTTKACICNVLWNCLCCLLLLPILFLPSIIFAILVLLNVDSHHFSFILWPFPGISDTLLGISDCFNYDIYCPE